MERGLLDHDLGGEKTVSRHKRCKGKEDRKRLRSYWTMLFSKIAERAGVDCSVGVWRACMEMKRHASCGITKRRCLHKYSNNIRFLAHDEVGMCRASLVSLEQSVLRIPAGSIDMTVMMVSNCCIKRAYRDAHNRLLWRNKTCPAHT